MALSPGIVRYVVAPLANLLPDTSKWSEATICDVHGNVGRSIGGREKRRVCPSSPNFRLDLSAVGICGSFSLCLRVCL